MTLAWSEELSVGNAIIDSDWLTNHIVNEDMLMKPMLQTYPYDFNPGSGVGINNIFPHQHSQLKKKPDL